MSQCTHFTPALTLCLLTLHVLLVAPASGSVAVYTKAQKQSTQMQAWKRQTKIDISYLDTGVKTMEASVKILNDTLDAAFREAAGHASTLESAVDSLIVMLQGIQAGTVTPPTYQAPAAFEAYVGTGGYTGAGTLTSPFKYVNVKTNNLNRYDSTTGLFTAPKNGLYWFYCTLKASTNGRDVHIRRLGPNGFRQDIGYIYYYVSQETSATTLAYLKANDTVGVYPTKTDNSNWVLTEGVFNGFAGYMVASDA